MRRLLTGLILLAGSARLAAAQSTADSAAIRATALDYIEGWYAGDAARMERALHPELAKRIVETDARGRSRLGQQSAMTLVMNTRRGGGTDIPADKRKSDVRILDVYGNAASVRVQAASWVDYLHVAKSNGRWVIVNVLWELDPPGRALRGDDDARARRGGGSRCSLRRPPVSARCPARPRPASTVAALDGRSRRSSSTSSRFPTARRCA
jgi:hypothetical protein